MKTAERPSVRVVIVNWRQPRLTLRAVASIKPQLDSRDQLVVVDNHSGDDSLAQLRQAGIEPLQTQANLGFGAGVNLGAGALNQDVLVLLNNDAQARPGFVNALATALEPQQYPQRGAATALMLLSGRWRRARADQPALIGLDHSRWTRTHTDDPQGIVLINSTGNCVDKSGNGFDRSWLQPAANLDASASVFGICGGACAIRADVWRQLGGFREDLFMYYEDTEFSWRLHEHGYQVSFVPAAVADHDHAASSGTNSPMKTLVNTRNRLLVAGAHAPLSTLTRALARTSVRAARQGFRGPVASGLKQALQRLPRELARRHTRGTTSTLPA